MNKFFQPPIRVKGGYFYYIIILLILIVPDDVFGLISIYHSGTPNDISYEWLDYDFGFIYFFLSIYGIYVLMFYKPKIDTIIVFLLLIREIFFFLSTDANIFTSGAFEMYLAPFVAYSLFKLTINKIKYYHNIEWLYIIFLTTNMLTIFLQYAMGGNEGVLEGRYHCSNLDVGGSGCLCVILLIMLFFVESKKFVKYSLIILSLIALWLTGSRSNLLFFVLFIFIYYTYNIFISKEEKISLAPILLFVFLLAVIIYSGLLDLSLIEENRLYTTMVSGDVGDDDSVLGRTESIIAGLNILESNIFGLSGYFINLQRNMAHNGFPTFPHSSLLASYLLFGPIIILVFIYWYKLIMKMPNKIDNKYFWITSYLFISNIVYGSPWINFKVYYEVIMVTFLAHMSLRQSLKYQPIRR